MTSTKLVVVLGATGNQGGSVAEVYLQSDEWKVRAITRNPSSDNAQDLAARGAEVVQANLDDRKSLKSAFEGANAIFVVTDFMGIYNDPANKGRPAPGQTLNFWAAQHETQQMRNAIDVAADVPTLDRFIISSLSNAKKWSKGKYPHVYHFDSKAIATEYAKETYPELWSKTSIYQAGWFLSNFVENPVLQPRKTTDNTLQLIGNVDADLKLPIIAAEEDSGPFVKSLIDDEPGKNLIGYRGWATLAEVAQIMAKVTGVHVEVVTLPKGQFPLPIAEELVEEFSESFAYWNEFGFEGRDDKTIIHPHDLSDPPTLATIEDYLRKHDWINIAIQK
ncbi:hypothetical protein NW762_014646 [Fusarium torreyae]|uniref:NmrA-like domain-containing protein n=1 Tax=Fusarium torreyae TaxID=1237075 RepID=A0A9W8RJM5_9HYPO|nr:hypothetical protein NW762_014646 [Fusarium torreyae]